MSGSVSGAGGTDRFEGSAGGGGVAAAEGGAGEGGIEPGQVRRLWHLLEPLHAVLYYAPESFEEAAALGFGTEERWPSYFPYRAAPLGPVGAERVASAFYSFSPRMVDEHITSAWRTASPQEVLAARERSVDRAYRALLGDGIAGPGMAEAAALARRAAEAADTAGRPLAAAGAALDWPEPPHLQLWHAATILREHRGDGHLAALLVAGLDPVESLVSFAAIGAASVERFESRGWSPRNGRPAVSGSPPAAWWTPEVSRRTPAVRCAARSRSEPTDWPPGPGSRSVRTPPVDSPICWASSGWPSSARVCCPRRRRWGSGRCETGETPGPPSGRRA